MTDPDDNCPDSLLNPEEREIKARHRAWCGACGSSPASVSAIRMWEEYAPGDMNFLLGQVCRERAKLDAVREVVAGLRKRAEECRLLQRGYRTSPPDRNRLHAKAETYEHAAQLVEAALGRIEP